MDIYTVALIVFLISFGLNFFMPERTIALVAAVAALVAGIVLLVRLVQ